MPTFTDDLLRSVGCWQNGWKENQELRLEIGAELELHSSGLDDEFRTVNDTCYRKRFIHEGELIPFVIGDLIEGPASWTLDPKFAEEFKGIERPDAHMGAIFARKPHPEEVIVNIDALWANADFRTAIETYAGKNGPYADALVNFGNKQREVVLQSSILPGDIFALSGRSDSFDVLCEQAGILDESKKDAVWKALVDSGTFVGEPKWIDQAGALRVIGNVQDKFAALIERYRSAAHG
ncbi:hypothetical protein [Hyphomonas jannaschiana]|uniref:hypothetical protein n=1 Tax=Hyphomonas jannaschiana TaxID=86 RepID=UPI0035C77473